MDTLFEQFVKERKYIKNSAAHTLSFYRQSFKTFALDKPYSKLQLNERIVSLREGGMKAVTKQKKDAEWKAVVEKYREHPIAIEALELLERVMKGVETIPIPQGPS